MIPLRTARELVFQLDRAEENARLARILSTPSIFLALDRFDAAHEMLAAWHKLRSAGIDPVSSIRTQIDLELERAEATEQERLLLSAARLLESLDERAAAKELCAQALGLATSAGSEVRIARAESELAKILVLLGEWDSGLSAGTHALEIFERLGDREGMCDALMTIGNVHARRASGDQALEAYGRLLSVAEEIGDHHKMALASGSIGTIYMELSRFDRAVECYERQLAICSSINDRRGTARALNYIGNVHFYRGALDTALEYYQRQLAMSRVIGDRSMIQVAFGSIANVHTLRREDVAAMEAYTQQIELCREIGDRANEAAAIGNMGVHFYNRGEFDRAMECYEHRLRVAKELGDRRAFALTIGNVGNIHSDLGDFDKALACHQQQLEISRELEYPRGVGIAYGNIAVIRLELGELEDALENVDRALSTHRSIGIGTFIADWLRCKARIIVSIVEQYERPPEVLYARLSNADDGTWSSDALRLARGLLEEAQHLEGRQETPSMYGVIMMARIERAEGNVANAVRRLEHALAADTTTPERAELLYWLWKLSAEPERSTCRERAIRFYQENLSVMEWPYTQRLNELKHEALSR